MTKDDQLALARWLLDCANLAQHEAQALPITKHNVTERAIARGKPAGMMDLVAKVMEPEWLTRFK